ncbi:hypothetical protein NMY22_g9173 [Coprinellus aureogranulatus]|nr:hypothetical protein NMY22_g9173 [Coprinellus aureogranulatus]
MSVLEIASSFVLKQLTAHRNRPLVVGLQGPQGSGKSFLASQLAEELSQNPLQLRIVTLSIDDLYLPHSGLVEVARAHPDNPLLNGRGQPGTHDVDLGIRLLHALRSGSSEMKLPSFDKSLFGGEGDRLPMDNERIIVVKPPGVDLVIVEGWFVGFHPISDEELDEKWERIWERERQLLGIPESLCRKENVVEINQNLRDYQPLWDFLDIFIQARPIYLHIVFNEDESVYAIIYQWRLEQERYMKSINGNRGMSDESVVNFVHRYIPGYVFFLDTLDELSKWEGKKLRLTLDKDRRVIKATIP